MDQNFQTSFIPKKPMIEERITSSQSISLLTILSILIFATVLIASGALYFYKGVLTKNIVKMESDLTLAQNRFEPAKILQLQTLDKRLRASNEILSKHITVSPIFETLQSITLKNVGYTKFNYSINEDSNGEIMIKISGIAKGYESIALQSDIFAKYKYFINPVFSNLLLDDKGNVVFNLSFSVDLNFVDYKKVIEATNGDSSGIFLNSIETLN